PAFRAAARVRTLRRPPSLGDAARVVGDEACRVRRGAVGQDLQPGATAPLDRRVEILRDHDEAAQLARDDERLELASIAREARIEITGCRERRAELGGCGASILHDDAD